MSLYKTVKNKSCLPKSQYISVTNLLPPLFRQSKVNKYKENILKINKTKDVTIRVKMSTTIPHYLVLGAFIKTFLQVFPTSLH